jgi:predicted dehydrogenase
MIGCGLMATNHATAYAANPMTEIVAAADPDAENLDRLCRRFGVPARYSSYEEMLEKERIDIAAPVLPVSANPDAVVACARAGVRAIFCEKPIAASLEDADRMVDECRSRGIVFACGDAFRSYAQLWKARRLIESGEIGEVRSINAYEPTTEMSGGGCQTISVVRMFAGDADVEWVVGWVAGDPASDTDQGMGGYLRFANGIECFLHSRDGAKKGVEVVGQRGVFFHSGWFSFNLWQLAGGSSLPRWADLQESKGLFEDVPSESEDRAPDATGRTRPAFRTAASVQGIVDALEKGIGPRCSGDDMRAALEIAIALRESHRRGHSPVKIPLEDRSLKLMPARSRWLNKKEVYGEREYAQRMAHS